jgi:hypothetical protein
LRRPVDLRVVEQVKKFSQTATADSWFLQFVRAFFFPLLPKIPWLRARMLATVSGQDHPLPRL